MITYESICFCCKQPFLIKEGTTKYQKYKRNMRGKFSCDHCDDKIHMEARKRLMGKLQ